MIRCLSLYDADREFSSYKQFERWAKASLQKIRNEGKMVMNVMDWDRDGDSPKIHPRTLLDVLDGRFRQVAVDALKLTVISVRIVGNWMLKWIVIAKTTSDKSSNSLFAYPNSLISFCFDVVFFNPFVALICISLMISNHMPFVSGSPQL